MALVHKYRKKFQGVDLRSGYFYKFKYTAWRRDPHPLIVLLAWIEGINKKTGHQWRLIQAINFSYIPRAHRKRFLNMWMKELDKPGSIKLTWRKVLAKYPYLKPAIRRYFFKPTYYIKNLEAIPLDRVEHEVISTWHKDFSKKIKMAILSKFRQGLFFKRKQKNEAEKKKKKLIAARKKELEKKKKR